MVKRFREALKEDEDIDEKENTQVKRVLEPVEDRRRSRTIKIPRRHNNEPLKDESVSERNGRMRIEEELLRACLSEGMQRDEILRLMKIGEHQLSIIEKRLLANDGQRHLTMTAAHRYYMYTLQQEQCVRDLDGFIQESHDAINNWNKAAKLYGSPATARKVLGPAPSTQSGILAVKAKSEILDRTIKMGQDIGIIQKRAKEVRVSGQLNLAALPTEQLKKELTKKLDQFQALVSRGKVPSTYRRMLEKTNGRLLPGRSEEPESIVDAEFIEKDTRSVDRGED